MMVKRSALRLLVVPMLAAGCIVAASPLPDLPEGPPTSFVWPDQHLTAFHVAPATKKYSLLVFGATWCGACQLDKPTVEKIKALDKVHVFKFDADNNAGFFKRYNVRTMPTYIVVDADMTEIDRTNDVDAVLEWAQKL